MLSSATSQAIVCLLSHSRSGLSCFLEMFIVFNVPFLLKKRPRKACCQAERSQNKDFAFAFLAGNENNAAGDPISKIWEYTDWQLEHIHNYIQWLFPIDTPSEHHFEAPVITKSDVELLDGQVLSQIQTNMVRSLSVMLQFYGFTLLQTQPSPVIIKQNFDIKKENWCVTYNHNQLRITRILKSLRIFALEQYAEAFYQALINAEAEEKRTHANKCGYLVNLTALRHWREAAGF